MAVSPLQLHRSLPRHTILWDNGRFLIAEDSATGERKYCRMRFDILGDPHPEPIMPNETDLARLLYALVADHYPRGRS